MDVLFFFFFFQAEDGIRDLIVTGVQTCALPIFGIASQRKVDHYPGPAAVDFVCEHWRRASDKQVAITGVRKVSCLDSDAEHGRQALAFFAYSKQRSNRRSSSISGNQQPRENPLFGSPVAPHRHLHALGIILRYPNDPRRSPALDASPSLEPFP